MRAIGSLSGSASLLIRLLETGTVLKVSNSSFVAIGGALLNVDGSVMSIGASTSTTSIDRVASLVAPCSSVISYGTSMVPANSGSVGVNVKSPVSGSMVKAPTGVPGLAGSSMVTVIGCVGSVIGVPLIIETSISSPGADSSLVKTLPSTGTPGSVMMKSSSALGTSLKTDSRIVAVSVPPSSSVIV